MTKFDLLKAQLLKHLEVSAMTEEVEFELDLISANDQNNEAVLTLLQIFANTIDTVNRINKIKVEDAAFDAQEEVHELYEA